MVRTKDANRIAHGLLSALAACTTLLACVDPTSDARGAASATSEATRGSLATENGRRIVFRDEFDAPADGTPAAPNPAFWDYDVDYVRGHDKACFTEDRRENVRVETRTDEGAPNGYLVLELRKEPTRCPQATHQEPGELFDYSSGSITTRKKGWGPMLVDMSFGRYEIRAKLPEAGRGTLPAIWLLGDSERGGWPVAGEIDIMEQVGWEAARGIHRSYSTLHRQPNDQFRWPTGSREAVGHYKSFQEPLAAQFHVWALEWTPTSLAFFLDGEPVGQAIDRSDLGANPSDDAWPFSRPFPNHQFYLILDLAFGGDWGGNYGVDDTMFDRGPVQMLVDYVRVYAPER